MPDHDKLYLLLRSSHRDVLEVVNALRDPLLVLDRDLVVVSANPAFYETFETGSDETIDTPFLDLAGGHWDIGELRLLLEQVIPKSASIFDYEVTATFPVIGHRTMLISAQRIAQPESGRRLLLLTMADATEQRRKERSKDLLIGELQHRIMNLLSVTQALAQQTSVKNRTAEEYRDAFLGRFKSLGKVLDLTARVDTAELPALARLVLEPYMSDDGPVVLERGPHVSLTATQAMALGMILHELATNAVKYGALSIPDRQVTIAWKTEDTENEPLRVNLRWRESGGPKVTAPDSKGFGTRLVKFASEHDLGGRVEQDYDPDGLIVTLSFPLM